MALNHIHGKNATIYIGANGGTAVPIGEQIDWSLDMDIAMVDVSPLNTTWKTFVKGMLGWSGALNGNFHLAQTQLWTASLSDVPENFYLYPTSARPLNYYYGTAWIQLTKIAAGSTTTKASSGIKFTGDGTLGYN